MKDLTDQEFDLQLQSLCHTVIPEPRADGKGQGDPVYQTQPHRHKPRQLGPRYIADTQIEFKKLVLEQRGRGFTLRESKARAMKKLQLWLSVLDDDEREQMLTALTLVSFDEEEPKR